MAVKQTTSLKTTTNLQTGKVKSFQTTYRTSTPTNIGKGGLSTLGRAGIIFITILAVSVGDALIQFTTADLIETTPNYQVKNDFVPIDDPLNDINYLQYGEEVVDNIMAFVNGFSAVGEFAYAGVYTVINFFENPVMYVFNLDPEDPNLEVFNWWVKLNRVITFGDLETATEWFEDLTVGNQLLYTETIYPEIFILAQWMFYSPEELGV
jgi:hypothetical protein